MTSTLEAFDKSLLVYSKYVLYNIVRCSYQVTSREVDSVPSAIYRTPHDNSLARCNACEENQNLVVANGLSTLANSSNKSRKARVS